MKGATAMQDEATTIEQEQGNDTLASLLSLFKSFLRILLPLIGLDFLTKYIDEIG